MKNASKSKQNHMWIKWFMAGAVKQPSYPKGSLIVNAACAHYKGPLNGKTHLMLGQKENAEPLCEVIVPTGGFGYDAGYVLHELPGNAVPVRLYPSLLTALSETLAPPMFSTGYMPHTDFRYEEFEGLLGSYYLTYRHLEVSGNSEKVAAFEKLEAILKSFAVRYTIQTPLDAAKNPRAKNDWGKPKIFRSYFSAKDCLGSFYRDFGVHQNSKEDAADVKALCELVKSPMFVF